MFKKYFQHDFYLAGPMRGKPDGNKDMFNRVAMFFRKQGYSIWNPAEQNDRNMTFSQCIVKDLDAIMHKCGAIALLPEWERSLGANTEALCAYVSGKEIYFIEPDENHKPELVHIGRDKFFENIQLPFNSDCKDFRQFGEMDIPENKIFNP
jgi:hypothetical protein